jgi:hypothetical protein
VPLVSEGFLDHNTAILSFPTTCFSSVGLLTNAFNNLV